MLKGFIDWYKAYRLKQAGLVKLDALPRDIWQQITDDCLQSGWEQHHICNALGSRLSDDRYLLRKGQSELSFSWYAELEGQIIGPERIVNGLAQQYKFTR